jgi:hypothetical protein
LKFSETLTELWALIHHQKLWKRKQITSSYAIVPL